MVAVLMDHYVVLEKNPKLRILILIILMRKLCKLKDIYFVHN